MTKLNIVFMGTPDFVLPVLNMLQQSPHNLTCVYSQPPRPSGRKQKLTPSPVQMAAENFGIPVRTPENFKNDHDVKSFRVLAPDVAVVAAYGMMLPQAILDIPRHGCLNIHPSLLPRWRGPSPVQAAIRAGDSETGVSLMRLVRTMDAGPLIAQQKVPVRPETDFETLNRGLWAMGTAMLESALEKLARNGTLDEVPQSEDGVTFCKILTRADGRLDWTQNALDIDRQIRALTPWPGVWTTLNDRRIKIHAARPAEWQTDEAPGTVLDRRGHIACGQGTTLQVLKLQPENAKPMDFAAALNGNYVTTGGRFA